MKKTLITIMVTLGMICNVQAGMAYSIGEGANYKLCNVKQHTMTQRYDDVNGNKVLIRTHYINNEEVYIEYLLVKGVES